MNDANFHIKCDTGFVIRDRNEIILNDCRERRLSFFMFVSEMALLPVDND